MLGPFNGGAVRVTGVSVGGRCAVFCKRFECYLVLRFSGGAASFFLPGSYFG